MLSQVALAIAGLAVLSWVTAIYFVVRLAVAYVRARVAGKIGSPPTSRSLAALLDWLNTLPPDPRAYARRFLISLGVFTGLVVLAMFIGTFAGPVRL